MSENTHAKDFARSSKNGHFDALQMKSSNAPSNSHLEAGSGFTQEQGLNRNGNQSLVSDGDQFKGFINGSIGRKADNQLNDLKKLGQFFINSGMPPLIAFEVLNPENDGELITRYQLEVLGWSRADGRIDPDGKTLQAMLDLEGKQVVSAWMVKQKEKTAKASGKEPQSTKSSNTEPKGIVANDGWTIAPVLSKDQFYSQAHPSKLNGVQGIPRNIAFSGAMKKYDRNEKASIYNESTVKTRWKKMSITKREEQVYWRACKNTATYMAKQGGYTDTGSAKAAQTLIEEGKSRKAGKDFGKGISRLDQYLTAGIPVVAGVDKGKKGLNASATDHFIVIVGRGQDESGKFYTYFDPGRTHTAGHNLLKNRLYLNRNASGEKEANKVAGNNGSKNYTLSEVREMIESN